MKKIIGLILLTVSLFALTPYVYYGWDYDSRDNYRGGYGYKGGGGWGVCYGWRGRGCYGWR